MTQTKEELIGSLRSILQALDLQDADVERIMDDIMKLSGVGEISNSESEGDCVNTSTSSLASNSSTSSFISSGSVGSTIGLNNRRSTGGKKRLSGLKKRKAIHSSIKYHITWYSLFYLIFKECWMKMKLPASPFLKNSRIHILARKRESIMPLITAYIFNR